MERGEYQFVADDRPCLVGQFQARSALLRRCRERSRSGPVPGPPVGLFTTALVQLSSVRARQAANPVSVSSPASAWWPTYSSSGSGSWALDVDIGAGVFQQQQTDPLHADRW